MIIFHIKQIIFDQCFSISVIDRSHLTLGRQDITLLNYSGNTIGKIDDKGYVRDKSGNTIGKIDDDGTVRNKSGNRIGKVDSDGTIRNASGNTIGKAQGVDRRRAGAYFFFNYP